MFLGMLNDEEKRAFTFLAGHMIDADGIIVASELQALSSLRQEMGLPDSRDRNEHDVEKLASAFTSRQAKIVALLELVGLCYSDSTFSVREESFVSGVAREMGIGVDELRSIDEWVKAHVGHVEAALAMMRG